MNHLSKAFYFWSFLFAEVISLFLTTPVQYHIEQGDEMQLFTNPIYIIGSLFSIYGGIVIFVFIYKIWRIIPAYYARTTPGKAIGFMLIPFYDLYWIFQVIYGWAQDFNTTSLSLKKNWHTVSENLGLMVSTVWVASFFIGIIVRLTGIPFKFTNIVSFASFALLAVYIYKVCDAINAIEPEEIQTIIAENTSAKPSKKRGFGIASLVLGILSVITFFFGVVFGIVGIILSLKQRKIEPEGFSKAGLILSIIGIAIGLILTIVIFSE